MCKISMHDRLYLAPLKTSNIKRALDFGTGTGIWAIEFGSPTGLIHF
jgi:methylase of polypeptide subunit release factors